MASPSVRYSQGLSQHHRQILGFLYSFCSEYDLGVLHDFFRNRDKQDIIDISAECRRNCKEPRVRSNWRKMRADQSILAIFISPDQRSSLDSTISSIFSSRNSCASIEFDIGSSPLEYGGTEYSYAQQGSNNYIPIPQTQDSNDRDHSHVDLSQISRSKPVNQPTSFFCLTCSKGYNDQSALDRHRRDQCESKGSWICLICLPKRKTYDRKSNWVYHHRITHNQEAPADCDSSFNCYPQKQAWGCPCCIRCFDNVDKWHEHEELHRDSVLWDGRAGDVKVVGWTFNTLILSLISGLQTQSVTGKVYDCAKCDWIPSTDPNKDVQFVLERHTLPAEIIHHPEYTARDLNQNLLAYAYFMGTNGTPFMGHVPAPSSLFHNMTTSTSYSRTSIQSNSTPQTETTVQHLCPAPLQDVHSSNQVFVGPNQERLIARQSTRPIQAGISANKMLEMSERCSENLNKFYPLANSMNMEKIPLVQSTFAAAPQDQIHISTETSSQRGRSRQSSQSSEICDHKRPKLSRSRSRSRRDLSSGPNKASDRALAFSDADAPPLPSYAEREAAIRNRTMVELRTSTLSSSSLPYETPRRQADPQSRTMALMNDRSQSMYGPFSQKPLPVQVNHVPINHNVGQPSNRPHMHSPESEFSDFLNYSQTL